MAEGNILRAIIEVSEKAAKIARAIREEDHLLKQEKDNGEKNPRFTRDYKTFADVLVQEVVKHDLGLKFPDLIGRIYGEENNEFKCSDGESINLKVGQNEDETKDLIFRILKFENVAVSLAHLVHMTVTKFDIPDTCLPIDNIGIWIDPIDSTGEYIAGEKSYKVKEGICMSGLPCVTILIGAFHLDSGLPLLGVVNQPYHNKEEGSWLGKIYWGVCHDDIKISSITNVMSPLGDNLVVVVSGSEDKRIKTKLKCGRTIVVEASGAGYKLLCVATGMASAYVLSKPSTYYWDTCGPQALLLAQGFKVINYKLALSKIIQPLKVSQGGQNTEDCCNVDGLIAYRDFKVLDYILELINE